MTIQFEKFYDSDGQVAVLYSPEYGGGWSTWAHTDYFSRVAMFDRRFVQAYLDGVEDIEELAKEIFGEEYFYTGGWDSIAIQWMSPGTKFRIREYDGAESIEYSHNVAWNIA